MRGYGVSKGLCYARILVLNEEPIVFPTKTGCILEEEEKFKDAHRSVLAETRALRDRTREESGNNAAEIIDIQCSLLKDNGLIDPIRKEIAGGTGAAAAVENVMNGFIKQFEGMENQYFAQRAVDLKDLKNNLIYKILNIPRVDITMLAEPTIIAGNDITPSQTARMDQHMVSGLLMEFGGNTSHTAILARTLDIPAIVGIKGLLKEIKTGDMVGFDGETGEIFTNLTKVETASLQTKIQEEKQRKERLQVLAAGRAATLDGKLLEVLGNIGMPADAQKVCEEGGEGIGLFRSEFLYLSSGTLPDEEMQFTAYKEVLQKMGDQPVTVRTLDIGGDKDVPGFGLKKESNPFLGLRAIRLCMQKKEIFNIQLRALLRASVYGNLRIMFPMISSLEELRFAKEQIRQCKEQLAGENIPFKEEIPLGIMVEVPAVALMAECFARECDFFSIGTNDLTQYSLAVDRGNESVAQLYSYYHPAVLRLIKASIFGAHKNGIPCGMCGEAAGDLLMLPVLIGMGLDEYSMTASSIPEIKERVGKLSVKGCEELAEKVLACSSKTEVERELKTFQSYIK